MRNVYFYYHIPKQLRDLINRFIPGLLKEPIPVRVPVERQDRTYRKTY